MKISELMNGGKPKRIFKCFSVSNSSPVSTESVPVKINFSENPDAAKELYEIINFSLLERIRLSKLSPRLILRRRVNEVVRYLRGNNLDNIKNNKDVLLQYLNEYIYLIIVKLMNDPKITLINLILVLGLPSILKDLQSVRNLLRFLLRTKREINLKGYISRILLNKLSKYYTEFWEEFLKSLESRYLTGEKVGALSGRLELDQTKLPILAQFSKSKNEFVNKVEDKIYNMMDTDEVNYDDLFSFLDKNNLPIDKKEFILDDEDLSKIIYDYLNNHKKEKVIDYLDKATLKSVKVNFSYITNFAEVPIDNFANVTDPNLVNQLVIDPNTGLPIDPNTQLGVQPQNQVPINDPNLIQGQVPVLDPNMILLSVDPNLIQLQFVDPNMAVGLLIIDPSTQLLMILELLETDDESEHTKLVENDEYKVGAIKGPKYTAAYVAFATKSGYRARIYKLPTNKMNVNFAELVKLPCKSVNINSISEISNYLRS